MQLHTIYQGGPMPETFIQSIVEKPWDVIVIGGGNAGVTAAITAAER